MKEEAKEFEDFMAAVKNALPRFLGPEMKKYINDPNLGKKLEDFFNHEMYYKNVIDYGISFDQVVSLGKYDKVEEGIDSANFETKRKTEEKEVIFKLSLFPKAVNVEDVFSYFKEINIRPVSNYELIWFGFLHPELQKRFMIHSLDQNKKLKDARNCLSLSYYTYRDETRMLVKNFFHNEYRKDANAFLGILEE